MAQEYFAKAGFKEHGADGILKNADGKRLAFVGRDGNFDIFTVGADGSGTTRITQDEGDNEDPSWSPDGSKIVFKGGLKYGGPPWYSTATIYTVNLDGSGFSKVIQDADARYDMHTSPHWGPAAP